MCRRLCLSLAKIALLDTFHLFNSLRLYFCSCSFLCMTEQALIGVITDEMTPDPTALTGMMMSVRLCVASSLHVRNLENGIIARPDFKHCRW